MSSERYVINNDGATCYHTDPDCRHINDTVSPRDDHYLNHHDLKPCPTCAPDEIPVWVARGNHTPKYHTNEDCRGLEQAANIKRQSLADVRGRLEPCQLPDCEGDDNEAFDVDERPCPHCGEAFVGQGWALHVKHCDGGDGDE